ncbi:UNVERIFIED_CONTAM: hypothetical protein Slati_3253900 [Sesamum latifolium]|uniref:Phytocyanin domain-containing protein n=1 Tax=Sesamum latifolium TaxID=2727402 RepID=A0AAW2V128_9LAMI
MQKATRLETRPAGSSTFLAGKMASTLRPVTNLVRALNFQLRGGRHNVVVVDKASYDSCSVPAGAPTYRSGNDTLTLKKGANYFICGFTGHCQNGMKIAPIAAWFA